MPDDSRPPRRKGSMGDTERVRIGKRHRTSPHGVPIMRGRPEDFADEPTPTPVPIPDDATMTPEEQLAAVQDLANMSAVAISRLRAGRDTSGDRLDRIETKQDVASREISELSALIREFLMPAVKASQGRIDLLLQHHEANKVRVELFYDREWPAAVKALEGMTERLGRVERTQERQELEVRGMSERLNANHGTLAERVSQVERLEARLAVLERGQRDRDVVSTAMTLRTKTILGFVVTVGGMLAGAVGSLLK